MSGPIRQVRYADVFDAPEFPALLHEYASECSLPQIGPINPQRHIYDALDASGQFFVFAAYYGSEIVGFAFVIESVLPHYGQKVATLESIFVAKDYREQGFGMHLMAEVERHAYESGCVAVLYSAPTGGQLEQLLNLLKSYKHTNTVFCRSLR